MSTTISTTSKNFFLSIKKYLFDNGIFYSYSAENERYTLNILGLTQQESKELLTKFLKPIAQQRGIGESLPRKYHLHE